MAVNKMSTQDQARQKLGQGFPSASASGLYWGAILTKDPRTIERYISGRPIPENVVQAILGHSGLRIGVTGTALSIRYRGRFKQMIVADTEGYALRMAGPALAGWIAASQGRRMDYKGRTHDGNGDRSDAPYVSKDARAVWKASYLFRKKLK